MVINYLPQVFISLNQNARNRLTSGILVGLNNFTFSFLALPELFIPSDILSSVTFKISKYLRYFYAYYLANAFNGYII